MKNAFKLGALALAISVSFAACSSKKTGAAGDTTKTDSTVKMTTDTTVKKDTMKMDSTKKMTTDTTKKM